MTPSYVNQGMDLHISLRYGEGIEFMGGKYSQNP
jgi:hypothetical protein